MEIEIDTREKILKKFRILGLHLEGRRILGLHLEGRRILLLKEKGDLLLEEISIFKNSDSKVNLFFEIIKKDSWPFIKGRF